MKSEDCSLTPKRPHGDRFNQICAFISISTEWELIVLASLLLENARGMILRVTVEQLTVMNVK